MTRKELLTEFYKDKKYEMIISNCINSKNAEELYYVARSYTETQDYEKAIKIFNHIGCTYESGRCELLQGHYEEAKKIWMSIKEDSPATLWSKSLLELINLYVIHPPTFFQIRAFLECDLDALLKAEQINFCENIVNCAKILQDRNQETYKFIGRVFTNNEYYELASLFLDKAKDVCYIDPEVHFLLAKCYVAENDIKKAQKSLETCIKVGYGYFPAKKMLKELNIA